MPGFALQLHSLSEVLLNHVQEVDQPVFVWFSGHILLPICNLLLYRSIITTKFQNLIDWQSLSFLLGNNEVIRVSNPQRNAFTS